MVKVGILGDGEVGKAIHQLYFAQPFEVTVKDKDDGRVLESCSILHICIPYSEDFVTEALSYINICKPVLTIIHSTIKPGTTKHLQSLAPPNSYIVHSPVRGNHPYLYDSLKHFAKYIGSDTEDGKLLALEHLKYLGLNVMCMKSSFSTELAKLLCTTYYGVCIAWHQLAKNLCDEHDLNFSEVMTEWNNTYNEGYKKIYMENVIRPVLSPPGNKIGGHCVIPNAELLSYLTESSLIEEVLKFKGD